MALVIKRSPEASLKDLVKAIDAFLPHLNDLGEKEAFTDLTAINIKLASMSITSTDLQANVAAVIDTFEGDHELSAYIINRKSDEWSEKDLISQAAARVLNLSRRLKK